MAIDISKRSFLRRAGKKISEVAIEQVEDRIPVYKVNWYRPPFAVDEFEFIVSCLRCDACINACEVDVLFALTAGHGTMVAGTPVMDLTHNACLLCDNWPCVLACESGVLGGNQVTERSNEVSKGQYNSLGSQDGKQRFQNNSAESQSNTKVPDSNPVSQKSKLPKLADVAINRNTCLPFIGPECGICVNVCPIEGALQLIDERPVVDNQLCVGCAQCRAACVTDPSSIDLLVLA
ncbi:hypothetical protein MNBD_GAMMA12-1231 [hydrothermal vent metagenome]|uniref:4Fe-4S ferredoxin-type domain-containing protein n=1 Tax=hydrothermal vent metagenome TaxID=652676 RepID=A0A3B0YHR0_9ZZZZ